MSERRKPVPYDAYETDELVGFVLDAEPLAGLMLATRVMDGHGVELSLADHTTIRFGNVHPRLMAACRTKPVAVVALHGDSWSIAMPAAIEASGVESPDPDHAGIGRTLAWYFDHCAAPEDLAERPLGRFLSVLPRSVTAVALGIDVAGPPFGLCMRSRSVIALPTYGGWNAPHPRLMVDAEAMSPPRRALPVDGAGDVTQAVMKAFSDGPAERVGVLSSRWRTQLAIRVGT